MKNIFSYYNDNSMTTGQNVEKNRNPGIDLIRLIGMYNVILNHFLFIGDAFKKYPKYKNQLTILHIFTDWHNNGFALISGIVGYKVCRYCNLLYLWLTVLFYSLGIHLYVIYFKKNFIVRDNILKDCFPIIFQRYWYFTAYFGMYLFLPVINKGISCLNKSELRLVVISTIGIFVFWRDFENPNKDIFNLKSGNSIMWLLIYFLTGAYIGKYKVIYHGAKKYIFCLICIIIYIFSSYLYILEKGFVHNSIYEYYKKEISVILNKMLTMRFDSFLKITQSLTTTLFCLQIRYNKYISKTICFLGPLAFGVYLIHIHPLFIRNVLSHTFDNSEKDISFLSIIYFIFSKALKTFFLCIIIDYFRNMIFKLLKLKKICILIEEYINNIIS